MDLTILRPRESPVATLELCKKASIWLGNRQVLKTKRFEDTPANILEDFLKAKLCSVTRAHQLCVSALIGGNFDIKLE